MSHREDGTLWTCGSNDCGQRGGGTATGQNKPVQEAKVWPNEKTYNTLINAYAQNADPEVICLIDLVVRIENYREA